MRGRSSIIACIDVRLKLLAAALGAFVVTDADSAHAARNTRQVVYSSECSCENDHGVARWRAKTDPADPPHDAKYIQSITPSEIFSWVGPGIIPRGGGRTGNELRWFALTGRVIAMGAETDGDVHLVLVNAYDDKPGKVIVEMPLGNRWCAMRTTAFSWTNAVFPFAADWQHSPFRLVRHPIINVVGKAFYDTDHSGKDVRNNRRPREKDKAVWEIHPVMKLTVIEAAPAKPIAEESAAALESEDETAPTPTATVAGTAQQLITLTQPVRIKIPYGETVIPAGTKLPVIAHDAATVQVRYLGETQTIPISSTDLH